MFKKFIVFLIIVSSIIVMADDYNLFSHEEEKTDSIASDSTIIPNEKRVQNIYTMNSEEYMRGITDAKKDAQGSVLFCFSGCCLQLIGILLPYIINYDPPAEKLMGKSADYIMGYSKQYNSSMKNKNMINAIIGYLGNVGVLIFYYVFIMNSFLYY